MKKINLPPATVTLSKQDARRFMLAHQRLCPPRHLEGKGIVAAPDGNWSQVLEQKQKFTAGIPEGTIQNFQKAGIDFVAGTAQFLDDKTLSVNGKRIQAKFFILATCAEPM